MGKKLRVITPKKGKRYYSYSLTLTIEQIEWLSSNPDSPELMRKVIDDLMNAESEAEVVRLEERAELLGYRANRLYERGHGQLDDEAQAQFERFNAEIREINGKIQQIKDNIAERERKKKEAESDFSTD